MNSFRQQLLLTGLMILLTRIPFIFDGFGSEEDAWALPVVAERIAETGIYEVSRLPGHPVQELSYSLMYDAGAVMYNLVTVLLSTAGLLAFAVMLRNFGHPKPLLTTLLVAFTPVVWLNSTNNLDYMWALSFLLAAGYFISRRFPVLAGLMTGLAVGCRITSGAMLFPYLLLLWFTTSKEERTSCLLRYSSATLLTSGFCFLPVYLEYGLSFFTYYEHFPIPGFAKNFYKGVPGVWGLPGSIAIVLAIILAIRQRKMAITGNISKEHLKGLLYCSALTILLYTISFLRLPLKSAFMIPLVPFVLLLLSFYLRTAQLRFTGIALFCSALFFGINLAEANRGSAVSRLAYTSTISGQHIAFDVLSGLVIADQSKRRQRIAFSKAIINTTSGISDKTFIIAGWWLADITYLSKDNRNPNVLFRYYTDEPELAWYKAQGYRIYYLEDQDQINDLRFEKTFTRKYAERLALAKVR